MDPRERADAALARARARGAFVVTPESAISPMDASSTLQIPRAVVSAIDESESTVVFPHGVLPQDELPAIAQEAATQSLAAPRRPPSPGPTQAPTPAPPEQVEGLVPTVKPVTASRPSVAQRLDG